MRGVPFNRRNRFILTAGFSIGYGATLVPNYFSNVFTYSGDNKSLQGFLDAIVLVMETGFAVTAIICMILNLTLPQEIEDIDERIVAPDAVEDVAPHKGMDLEKDESGRGGSGEVQPIAVDKAMEAEKPKDV